MGIIYAFRKDEALLAKVSAITDGASREDMIQELNDIAVFGKGNTALLEAINFDLTRLDQAAETADKMAELLARARGENDTGMD